MEVTLSSMFSGETGAGDWKQEVVVVIIITGWLVTPNTGSIEEINK